MTFISLRNVFFSLSLVAAIGTPSNGSLSDHYLIGPNVQVSLALPTAQHYETQIAADPKDAGHL